MLLLPRVVIEEGLAIHTEKIYGLMGAEQQAVYVRTDLGWQIEERLRFDCIARRGDRWRRSGPAEVSAVRRSK
jgi:hypothetical protein